MRHEDIQTTMHYYADLEAQNVAKEFREAYKRATSGNGSGNKSAFSDSKTPNARLLEKCVAKAVKAKATRPGLEPGMREPKSLVLPLHHRVTVP